LITISLQIGSLPIRLAIEREMMVEYLSHESGIILSSRPNILTKKKCCSISTNNGG